MDFSSTIRYAAFNRGDMSMKQEEKNRKSRAPILEYAFAEFAAQGYLGASVNTICAGGGKGVGRKTSRRALPGTMVMPSKKGRPGFCSRMPNWLNAIPGRIVCRLFWTPGAITKEVRI